MVVFVRDNSLDQANRILKRKMQKADIYGELRERKHHIKSCEIKAKTLAEKAKKISKFLKKRMDKEGY